MGRTLHQQTRAIALFCLNYDNYKNGTPIWFDGIKVRHDAVDEDLIGRKEMVEKAAKENEKLQRPKNTKSEKKD